MGITYVKGNLLDAFDRGDVNVIAHQTNCKKSLAKGKARGIAGEVGRRYPQAMEADNRYCGEVGGYSSLCLRGGKLLFNLYGQDSYGNSARSGIVYTDYNALSESMRKMERAIKCHKAVMQRLDCSGNPEMKIGFPLIGCGLAGGDWNIVSKMIEEVFVDYEVFVYTL